MNRCQRTLSICLFAGALAGMGAVAATAAPPTFADRVKAIETATATELSRLETALAAATDAAAALELQRCAAWVKLSSRLALHEAQLATAPGDPEVVRALDTLVTDLRAQAAAQAAVLPAAYVAARRAALDAEVATCAE